MNAGIFKSMIFFLMITLIYSQKTLSKDKTKGTKQKTKGTLEVLSPAFKHKSNIPVKYTCDGENISPPIRWSGAPEGTKSFALICDDPDAPMGTFVHWVIFNIPADSTELEEALPGVKKLKSTAIQGKNNFGKIGYLGPCPPKGKPHRYFFKLYALDTKLDLKAGIDKKTLLKTMKGHILAKGELMGYYKRN